MNENLKLSVEKLIQRAIASGVTGHKADKAEIEEINSKLGGVIPKWYIQMLTMYPLCGLAFQWQEYPEEDDFDGRASIFWSRPSDIWKETFELYPGIGILEKGCFNVGCDDDGMGDPYFISSNDGDNPTVYRVYHENVVGAGTKIGEFDAGIASKTLSDFFDSAIF